VFHVDLIKKKYTGNPDILLGSQKNEQKQSAAKFAYQLAGQRIIFPVETSSPYWAARAYR
jgi:hypothetical protein